MVATFLAAPGARPGVMYARKPARLYEEKSVMLSRVYHPTNKRHDLGIIGGRDNFPGFAISESVHYGPDNDQQTSPVEKLESTRQFGRTIVVRFRTTTGSIYELIVLGT